MEKALLEAFWKRVRVGDEDECWEWIGARLKGGGYGKLHRGGEYHYAHRLSYEIARGRKPKLMVLHSCDNPWCVNPSHLREGTNLDNVRDREMRGRSGDRSGENNNRTKLTWQKVREMRLMFEHGATLKDMASRYGISETAAQYIRAHKTWRE